VTTRSALTARYGVALSLLVCALLLHYGLSTQRIAEVSDDGRLINLSGIQRMLSQRTALLSLELDSTTDPATLASRRRALERTLDRFETIRAELSNGWRDRAANGELPYAAYLAPGGIDEQVSDYIALGERLLEHHRSDAPSPGNADASLHPLLAQANGALPDRLDAVVTAYQREFEAKVAHAARLELLLLVLGLMLIGLVGLLIFRPMASTIVSSVESLERANAELRAFGFRIAHDLRSPVCSSLGLIEIARESLRSGDVEDAMEVVDMIGTAMTRLDDLIDELLALERTRRSDEVPETVELPTLVDKVIESIAFVPRFERVAIRTTVELDSPAYVRPVLLRQALRSLLSNAIKYADFNKRVPLVEIAAEHDDHGHLRIAVSDNGLGIPEPARGELFGTFKRFHPGISTGSGMGLYLVDCSARKMGGTIAYEPLPDGSRFILTLPKTPDPTPWTLSPSY